MLKNTLVILAASLPLLAYSDDTADCEQYVYPLLPPEPIESCQLPVGIFHPGKYTLGNSLLDLSVGGEFLYFETNFDAVCAIGTKILSDAAGNSTTTELFHGQGYRPGFRVALGMALPCYDNWSLDAEYTWLHRKTTNHFNANPLIGEVIASKPLPQFFRIFSSALKSELKFNLNFCQAVVGRALYTSKRIIVTPGVGVKTWWALKEQNLTFAVLGGAPPGTQFTQYGIWGVGPYASVLVKTLAAWGTYLTGKVGIWPLYSKSNKYKTVTNYPVAVPPNLFPGAQNVETDHNKPFESHVMFEGGVRLGWGTYLCNCNYHVDMSVGYDLMSNIKRDPILQMGLAVGDFYYAGLTVRAQFDF